MNIHIPVQMTCLWQNKHREHLSDGTCSLYPSEESGNLVHVHHDTQYSTDPESGCPLALSLDELDPCEMFDFSLNRRICSVSTEVDRDEIHIADYEPKSAVEFWSIVKLIMNKWDIFHDKEGYWPSFCTVTDSVLNQERMEQAEPGAVRSLRPVHFVKNCTSFAAAINKLLSVWFKNYYLYVLNICDEDKLHDILSGSNDMGGGGGGGTSGLKARRIECDVKDHATGFWERYDPDKYKEMLSLDSKTDWSSVRCRLKHIMDKMSFARLHRESRKRSAAGHNGVNENDSERLYYEDDEDMVTDRPTSLITSERLRSKRLFHAVVVYTFGNHRDYPHTIMCKDFIVNDKRWCSMWLETVRNFSEYRLCRLRQECTDEEEEARTGIRQTMKDWNALFPTLTESIRQRQCELMKMLRKKKKSDSIARELGAFSRETKRKRSHHAEREDDG